MRVVKLWHVISSPLVTSVCTIIVTHAGATGESLWMTRLLTGQARADEETRGPLKDERQFWQIRRERHNTPSGGHDGGLVLPATMAVNS